MTGYHRGAANNSHICGRRWTKSCLGMCIPVYTHVLGFLHLSSSVHPSCIYLFCGNGCYTNRVRWKLSVYGQPARQVRPFGWRICTDSDVPYPAGVDGSRINLGSVESTTRRLKKSEQESDTATANIEAEILHVRC